MRTGTFILRPNIAISLAAPLGRLRVAFVFLVFLGGVLASGAPRRTVTAGTLDCFFESLTCAKVRRRPTALSQA